MPSSGSVSLLARRQRCSAGSSAQVPVGEADQSQGDEQGDDGEHAGLRRPVRFLGWYRGEVGERRQPTHPFRPVEGVGQDPDDEAANHG